MQIEAVAGWFWFLLPLVIVFAVISTLLRVSEQRKNKSRTREPRTRNADSKTANGTDLLMAAGIIVVVVILFLFALLMVLGMANFFDQNM